jgi:hydroxymethylpyrimidine pyrophosphatase-like HAD family hydrolase
MNFTAAFDVDGTIFTTDDQPRWEVIDLMFALQALGAEIYVWSGGGIEYAKHKLNTIQLDESGFNVVAKGALVPNLAVDDQTVKLGKTNMQV